MQLWADHIPAARACQLASAVPGTFVEGESHRVNPNPACQCCHVEVWTVPESSVRAVC